MASSIGGASVFLSTDATKLVSGLAKAESTITGWVKNLGNKLASLPTLPATFLTGLVGGGLTSGIFEVFDRVKQLSKDSVKLGIPVEDLSALQYAAKKSGVDVETLDHAILHLADHLSALRAGDSAAKRLFGGAGLDLEALKKARPDEAFKQIADAASKMDAVDRASLAMQVFGRAGLELAPLLAKGREGIEELQKKAKELGLTFSELDVSKVNAANSAIARIKDAVQGITNRLAVGFAPLIEILANGIGGLAEKIIPSIDAISKALQTFAANVLLILSKVAGGFAKLFSQLANYEPGWIGQKLGLPSKEQLAQAFGPIADFFDNTELELTRAGAQLRRADFRLPKVQAAPTVDAAQLKNTQAAIEYRDKLEDQVNAIGKNADAVETLRLKQQNLNPAIVANIESLGKMKEALEAGFQLVEKDPVELFKNQLTGLDELLKRNVITWNQFAQSVGKAAHSLAQASGVSAEIKAPELAFLGSREATSAIIRGQTGRANRDTGDLVREAIERQTDIHRNNNRELQQIRQALAEQRGAI